MISKRMQWIALQYRDVGYEYQIDMDRCNSSARVLGWIMHLLEKNWITKEHIEQFVQACVKAHGEAIIERP